MPPAEEGQSFSATLHRYCCRCHRKLRSIDSMRLVLVPVCLKKEIERMARAEAPGGEEAA